MSTITPPIPTSGSGRRRAKAARRAAAVETIVHGIEDRDFYATGKIPASATSASICSCGAREFTRGDESEHPSDFYDAHSFCDTEGEA